MNRSCVTFVRRIRSFLVVPVLLLGCLPVFGQVSTDSTEWNEQLKAARDAQKAKDWDGANAAYATALAAAEALDAGQVQQIKILEAWSAAYRMQQRPIDAVTLQERAIDLRRLGPDAESVEAVSALNRLGTMRRQIGPFRAAEAAFREALAIRDRLDPETKGPSTEMLLRGLAGVIGQLRPDDPEREALLLRNLRNEPEPAIHSLLGAYYSTVDAFEQAREQYALARELSEDSGREGMRVSYMTRLADQHKNLGEADRAETLYRDAIELSEARKGPEHPSLVHSLSRLGELYLDEGRFHDAEAVLERAVALDQAAWGERTHRCGCSVRGMLDQAQKALGRKDTAAPVPSALAPIEPMKVLRHEPAQAQEEEEEDSRTVVIGELDRKTAKARRVGEYDRAIASAEEALELREQVYGPNAEEVAHGIAALARLYKSSGRMREALSLYTRSVEIFESLTDPDREVMADAMHRAGILSNRLDRVAEADALLRRELEVRDAIGHRMKAAQILQTLGYKAKARQEYSVAESHLQSAAQRWEELAGESAPEIRGIRRTLAEVYIAAGRLADAEALVTDPEEFQALVNRLRPAD